MRQDWDAVLIVYPALGRDDYGALPLPAALACCASGLDGLHASNPLSIAQQD